MEGLEAYLAGRSADAASMALEAHIEACAECRAMVGGMRAQSDMVRVLKPGQEIEPAPGFYARVMERIEAQAAGSFWAVFLEPFFARRFMYASLALMMAMFVAAATVSSELDVHATVPMEMAAEISLPDSARFGEQSGRDVVLVNLASFGESLAGGQTLTAFPAVDE
jgi:predicted anti-sigma-YlaC factor YlaD